MKSIHSLLSAVSLLVICGSTSSTQAATIVTYDFSTDANPNTELLNTSSSTVVGGGGWLGSGRSTAGNFFGRGPSTTAATTYVGFTITADTGYTLDLTQLVFDYYVQQDQGITGNSFTFEVRSSADGFASTIPGTYSTNPVGVTAPYENATLNLSGGSYDGLSSIEFRLYATNDTESVFNDIVRWDNITVTGDVAAIPEPSAALLGGLGALLLLRRRRTKG